MDDTDYPEKLEFSKSEMILGALFFLLFLGKVIVASIITEVTLLLIALRKAFHNDWNVKE